jgi:hypothetical protein
MVLERSVRNKYQIDNEEKNIGKCKTTPDSVLKRRHLFSSLKLFKTTKKEIIKI